MTLRERIRALDRLQRTKLFKIIASVALVALVGVGYALLAINAAADGRAASQSLGVDSAMAREFAGLIVGGSVNSTGLGMGLIVVTSLALVVIWLGLGLTYLALIALTLGLAVPLSLNEHTEVYGRLIIGVLALTASFTALMQGLRVLLSAPSPILAVARNVLAEAVRLKISLVFIVLLILGLATLPGLLDESQPLRYRVQSFLQYATGGSFWIIAVLTLFFSVATITFEQRDKVIWQTMTKPVATWQYLLGKWIGVVGLNAVLLAVCASGIFLFTEYLRTQKANGEMEAYVSVTGPGTVSEDRRILESQILAARVVNYPKLPFSVYDEEFASATDTYIERERRQRGDDFRPTESQRRRIRADLFMEARQGYLAIPPSGYQRYRFEGLGDLRQRVEKRMRLAVEQRLRSLGEPVTEDRIKPILEDTLRRDESLSLRYRIDAEGNRPDIFYRLTFVLPDGRPMMRQTGLGFTHSLALSAWYIAEDGSLEVEIVNGGFVPGPNGAVVTQGNPGTLSFPPDGLRVTYSAGSYRTNFVRVVFVLWIKLAFLAMVAVWASTFLSFPVACLVAMGTFLAAEGSSYIADSVDFIGTTDDDGNFSLWRAGSTWISTLVGITFKVYADLRPTGRLVDGQLLPWRSVAGGTGALAGTMAVLYALAVLIFRRRELATYSGQ